MPKKIDISPPQRKPTKFEVGTAVIKPQGQAKNDFMPGCKNVGNSRGPVVDVKQNPGSHKMRY